MAGPATLADAILARLHPHPYPETVEVDGLNLLLLSRGGLGSYALAVLPWLDGVAAAEQVERGRATVRAATGAMWMLREYGAYLVFVGPEASWSGKLEGAAADRTGLHHVIVQGLHWIDPVSGATELKQSAWGPVKFGGVDSVATAIEEIEVV
jgi:hypothetical protein